MKKIDVIFLFLTFTLFLSGCSGEINHKLSSNQIKNISNIAQQVINESMENTHQYTSTKAPKSYSIKDIENLFHMTKREIMEQFGSDYSEGTLTIEECHIPLNVLMYHEGFTFFGLIR